MVFSSENLMKEYMEKQMEFVKILKNQIQK